MDHKEFFRDAISALKRADHLTYMTLPLVKDNKLILTVLDNISLAMIHGMNAALEYERMYKRIMPLPENFNSRYHIFRDKLINKYNITIEEVELIRKLRDMIEAHKSSPVEFSRPDKFVICNENFRMKTVTVQDIKQYIVTTRNFLRKINVVLK
ncbi:MAG: hypothetical protein KKG75_04650 [Nanoarchaeota archaeon]|nr:hypothetical protein [Nanoarchaeota archaeon]